MQRMRGVVVLTPKPQLNLQNARGYFREHLAVGDYYMDGHVVRGEWRGVAAQMLGLEGAVGEESFLAMCEGQHPETGQRLTMRHNTTRREGAHTVSNRRVFYDFTISPPKSVSVVALYQDARIIELHDKAARAMMDELEKFAETRVRKDGANTERVTGGVVAALFRHDTSRELDPHLHTHCVVFNATYDFAEEKWKALHASGMYRAQKFAENLYYHELAKGLRALGYEIENSATGFEIKGVPESVVTRFSKRHHQIDEETKKRIAAEGLRGNEKALRAQVAHDKRRRKIKNVSASAEHLRPRWSSEMSEHERGELAKISPAKLPPPLPPVASKKSGLPAFVTWAEAHLFERRSVVGDYELMSAALARGRGENFTLAELEKAVSSRGYIRDAESRKLTSRDALTCELAVVLAAQNGLRKHIAFNATHEPVPSLSAEQRAAVSRILRSRDFITLFQGGAGTGKSFTLREVVRGLEAARHPVVVLTPQHQQAADLRRDGLASADTLARILAGAQLPRGAVVIVDEAGQVGGRDMRAVIERVQACGGRLILSGDTRQQGAVSASDALRAIEEHTILEPVRLKAIRRQDPEAVSSKPKKAFVRKYRAAVKAASEGRLADSFDKLDDLGCVRELDADERTAALAREYCEALARNEKVLAVAQTWEEVRAANDAIRTRLRETGKLGAGVPVSSWQSADLSEAQKRDARFYAAPDAGVFFVRGYGRFKRGDYCEIVGADAQGVTLRKDGRASTVSYDYANRYVVTKTHELELARGDRLQMKFNGKSVEGVAIRNGELVTVKRILKDGRIGVVDDTGTRKTLAPTQRMFVPGYAVTSYASQGKTVDTVFVSHTDEQTTVNRNQWYVAISRARQKIVVFTGDKEALRLRVVQESDRQLALSLKPDAEAVAALRERLLEACQHDLSAKEQKRLRESVRQWMPPPLPKQQPQQKPIQQRGIRI